jgi:hypothetical protein
LGRVNFSELWIIKKNNLRLFKTKKMKITTKIASVLIALLLISGTVSAQLRFGAKAGLNISSQKVSVLGFSLTSKAKIGPSQPVQF